MLFCLWFFLLEVVPTATYWEFQTCQGIVFYFTIYVLFWYLDCFLLWFESFRVQKLVLLLFQSKPFLLLQVFNFTTTPFSQKIRNCKYFAMKKIIILSGSISYHITVCFQLKSYTVKISNFKSSKDMYYYIKHFFKVSKFKLLSAISFNFMQNYNVSFFNQNNTKWTADNFLKENINI